MMPPGFDPAMFQNMMQQQQQQGDDDEGPGVKPPTEIGEDEDFLFENFLKNGEYQHMQTKKR